MKKTCVLSEYLKSALNLIKPPLKFLQIKKRIRSKIAKKSKKGRQFFLRSNYSNFTTKTVLCMLSKKTALLIFAASNHTFFLFSPNVDKNENKK